MEYLVRWEINVEADSPEEAAITAFNMVNEPGTTATVFDVCTPEGELIEQIDAFKAAGGQ